MDNVERVVRALCQRGREDARGHLSEALDVLAKEVGLDVPGLGDLIDLNRKLFDCVQTQRVQEGVVNRPGISGGSFA